MKTMHLLSLKKRESTVCGRDLRDVKWTAGYTDSNRKVKVTCKSCLKGRK